MLGLFEHAMRMYKAMMFLLATHLCDVGDQVQLDNGDALTVERMSIMTMQFIKSEISRAYTPNTKLPQQNILNLIRSEKKNDSFRVTKVIE